MSDDTPELPRKILMTADAVGGVWQYSVDLSTALASAGTEVLVATLGPVPSFEQLQQICCTPGVTAVHGDYSLEWMPDLGREVDESGDWLLVQQQAFGADVIHLSGFSHASLPWRRPVMCVAHSCVRSWWRGVYKTEPGVEWTEYTRRVKAGLDASTLVVAPSSAMGRSLTEEYGTPAGKVRVIPNFSELPEQNGKQKEAVILAAGRMWDAAKNFGLLEEIALKLDWPIRVAGSERGPDGSSYSAEHLHMLGALPRVQLVEQLRRASIFTHPALYEPFGLSVLEAARSRCCLVLSNIPSLREIWDGAAIFLDPRDPESWVFEINELCRDFARRHRLSELAAKRSRRYSSQAILASYQNLYTSLLTGRVKEIAA